MADHKGGGGANPTGNSALLAASILVGIAALGLWFGARGFSVKFLYAPAWVELKLIEYTVGLGEVGEQFLAYVTGVFDGRVDAQSVYWADVSPVLSLVGSVMRWPIAVIITAMSVVTLFKMKGDGFKRRFSLTDKKKGDISFMRYQATQFHSIKPALDFNPDVDGGNEAPSVTPLEFLRDNNLSPIQTVRGGPITLPIAETEAVFAKQLGEPWTGLRNAPIWMQYLIVLAALNYSWRKERDAFGAQGNIVMTRRVPYEKKLEALAKLIEPHLKNKPLVKAIETVATKHHYNSTVLCAIYTWSRNKGGVLASAEVRWVKKIDRTIWYALNNLGRRSFHVEGAGIIAHFFSEQVNFDKIDKPYVLPAIEGLQTIIAESGISNLDAYFRETDDFKIAETALKIEDAAAASKKKGRHSK